MANALTCQNGAAFTGEGALIVGGSLTVAANATLPVSSNFILTSGGAVFGPGQLDATNGFIWNDGALDNLQMTVTGTTSIQGVVGATMTLDNSTLNLNGPTFWVAGDIAFDAGIIANRGLFTIQANDEMRAVAGGLGGTFENRNDPAGRGTISKTTAGQATFDINVWNQGTILVNGNWLGFHQGLWQGAGGITNLGNNGALDLMTTGGVWLTFNLVDSLLLGSGTINGHLNSSGTSTIKIDGTIGSLNKLTVEGNYTQGQNAILQIAAASDQSFGKLSTLGTASLNGTLELLLLGTYNPGQNTELEVLEADGGLNNSTFATVPAGWTATYSDVVKIKKN